MANRGCRVQELVLSKIVHISCTKMDVNKKVFIGLEDAQEGKKRGRWINMEWKGIGVILPNKSIAVHSLGVLFWRPSQSSPLSLQGIYKVEQKGLVFVKCLDGGGEERAAKFAAMIHLMNEELDRFLATAKSKKT